MYKSKDAEFLELMILEGRTHKQQKSDDFLDSKLQVLQTDCMLQHLSGHLLGLELTVDTSYTLRM